MNKLPLKLNIDFNNGNCDFMTLENIRKWLRDEQHVLINAVPNNSEFNSWTYMIYMHERDFMSLFENENYVSYEDAVIDAIKYYLNYDENEKESDVNC